MILDMSQDMRCQVCGEKADPATHECAGRRVETLVRTCPVCFRPMWQKHAEVCTGPRVCRIPSCTNSGSHGGLCRAHYEEDQAGCSCPPGPHLRDCSFAYWPEDAA